MKRKRITFRERVAYHEAGHAVARHLLELRLGRVTIKPSLKAGTAGSCSGGIALRGRHNPDWDTSDKNRMRMERDVQVCLAGDEADRHFAGRSNHVGSSSDRGAVIDLLCYFEGDVYEGPGRGKQEGFRTYYRLLQIWTRRLVTNPRRGWPMVEELAKRLLEKETLSGREAEEAIYEAAERQVRRAEQPKKRAKGSTS